MPQVAAWAIPSLIAGGSALLSHHDKNKAEDQARTDANAKAQAAYNDRVNRYNAALKQTDTRRTLAEDFINRHGLHPSQAIIDMLNAPHAAPPSFASVGGGLGEADRPSGASDFLGGAASEAGKLFSPKPAPPPPAPRAQVHDTGDFTGPTSGGVSPNPPPVDFDHIMQDASLEEKQ